MKKIFLILFCYIAFARKRCSKYTKYKEVFTPDGNTVKLPDFPNGEVDRNSYLQGYDAALCDVYILLVKIHQDSKGEKQ